MSKRLTDKEKAEVVADFLAGMNKSDIAVVLFVFLW